MTPDLRRDTVKLGNLLSIAEQIQAFGLGRKTGEIYITNVAPPARRLAGNAAAKTSPIGWW